MTQTISLVERVDDGVAVPEFVGRTTQGGEVRLRPFDQYVLVCVQTERGVATVCLDRVVFDALLSTMQAG